jgi:hypothetical protein
LLQPQQLIIINVIKPTSLLLLLLLLLWRLAGPCLTLLLVLVCLLLLNVLICMLLLLFWWPGVHKVWELGPHILQLDLHARYRHRDAYQRCVGISYGMCHMA